jgi:peptidoglycan-associated lipoprotein
MRRIAAFTLVLTIFVLGATSCRTRRKAPPLQTAPVVATTPETAVPVEVRERDFRSAESNDLLPQDVREADRVARDRGWIRDAFFGFDASTLDAEAQRALQQSGSWLRANPDFRIRIEGHCDERGTEQYNLALGDRRADSAATYLVALGVDRDRIETVSYGEERPFEEGSNEAAWAQNRRAHISLASRR